MQTSRSGSRRTPCTTVPRGIGDITHALPPGQVQDLISAFLESETKLSSSNQVMFSQPRLNVRLYQYYRDFSREGQRGVRDLRIAAQFGLCDSIVTLPASGHDPNCKDSDGRTPLWWAARSSHDKAIEILLAAGEVDPDPMDSQYESTPLMLAAQNGHAAVARLLLETGGVEADCRPKRYFYRGRTPPSYAAEKGTRQ
jgi:ankyrin repeat protein